MGRKRGFENADSSDEDFQVSGGEESASPGFSRLKRKRRPSARGRAEPRDSPPQEEEPNNDDDSDVICVTDSAEEPQRAISETPERPASTKSREEAPARLNTGVESPLTDAADPAAAEKGEDERTEVPHQELDETEAKDADAAGDNSDIEEENDVPTRSVRRAAPRSSSFDRSESDSESEPEHSEDDEDVYNSQEDEPDSDDAESDFEPSPVKVSKAKKSKTNARASTPVKKGASTASRRPAPKAPKVKRTPAAAGQIQKAKPKSGVKRLGARLPSKLSTLGKPSNSAQRQERATATRVGPAVFRAGLSRNAAIPRLHSYLPR